MIVTTAAQLFAAHGYDGVGMRAIADAVGIRPSSLYHYFPSKIDLLHAVALVASDAFISAQLPHLEGDGAPLERLERVLREHIRYFNVHRTEEAVGLRELAVLRDQAPERFEEVQTSRRRYQVAIERLIADGAFDVDDPHLAALAVLNLVNGINAWFRPDGDRSIDEVADAYLRMVRRLLAAPA